MKIRKIKKITGLGIFKDFSWNDNLLSDFSDFNLIYGWNYSGKTTLSRIFDCLRNPELTIQLEGSFELLDFEGEMLYSEGYNLPLFKGITPQNCRVFNRDFINRNFRQEHNAPAVYIVGDDAAKIRDRISTLEARKTSVKRAVTNYEREEIDQRHIIRRLRNSATRAISELISEQIRFRFRLEKEFEEIKDSLNEHILDETEFGVLKATAGSSDEFEELSSFAIPDIDISALVLEVNSLLSQSVSNNAIENLKEDAALEAWVRTGLNLHSSGNKCFFCSSMILDERFKQLKGHFSAEYESLATAIQDKIAYLQSMEIEAEFPVSAQLFHTVRQKYSEAISPVSTFVTSVKKVIPMLIEALVNKASKIETKQKLPNAVSEVIAKITAYKYVDKHKEIDELLNKHNEQISDMESTKRDAKNKLRKHLIARYYQDGDIVAEEEKHAELKARLDKTRDVLATIDNQIKEKEVEIKEHSVAIKKLNEEISKLLPVNNISALPRNDSEFEFRRGNERVANLSDGERTAIAFAYFLLTLEDRGNDLGNTIVFIDDPISSLDSNHIYAVYALIINRLKGHCKQLFVSTHNFEFFNLLKDEALNDNRNYKDDCAGYFTQRSYDEKGNPFSQLVEIPKALRIFKSEYQFLFSLLYQLATSTETSLHEAYTAPTILRKFLETYLGFRKPIPRRWSTKLGLLFSNKAEQLEVAKFANAGSHLQSLERAVAHSESIASAKEIVKKVLDAVELKDKVHFEGLKAAIED